MKIALVDLEEDERGCNNKEQTGTYGSVMRAGGLAGFVFGRLKKRSVRLPILSFGYLAAILRRQGHEVLICDSDPPPVDVALVATSIIGYRQEIELGRRIKRAQPAVRLGYLGAFAQARPECFLEVGDFVIHGEPERWAQQIEARCGEDGLVTSERVSDLETLPFPDWRGFPIERYGYYPLVKAKPFVGVLGSRGCPVACPFCQYLPMQGVTWRRRSAEHVTEELLYLGREFGIRGVLFRDIIFSINQQRVRELAEQMIRKRVRLAWGCETRTDMLTVELLRLMKAAGLRSLNIGVESADQEALERRGRKALDRSHLERIVDWCEGNGVLVNAFYLIGFPDDTEDGIERTIEYACRLNTSLAQFCVVTPYPGTGYFDEMADAGRVTSADWSEYSTYNPVMRLDHLTPADVRRLEKRAYNRYFLRPSWLLRRGARVLCAP